MLDRSPSLFWQLGKDKENQCGLPAQKVNQGTWQCVTEVQTPIPGGGRLDLRFSSDAHRKGPKTPVFVIENKVQSKLTREQLARYRRHKVKYLIAVTKHPPEVPQRQLRADGVFAIRWQDVHRHLVESRPTRPVDKFLIRSFLEYLEELKMAYPERLRKTDLLMCRRLLQVAVSPKRYKGLELRDAFGAADQCVQLLTELKRELVERLPAFERCRSAEPTFVTWHDNNEDLNRGGHAFSWDFRGTPYKIVKFSFSLSFPKSNREPITWNIDLYGTRVNERSVSIPFSRSIDRNGYVRHDYLLETLVKTARKWKAPRVVARNGR